MPSLRDPLFSKYLDLNKTLHPADIPRASALTLTTASKTPGPLRELSTARGYASAPVQGNRDVDVLVREVKRQLVKSYVAWEFGHVGPLAAEK
ncbi:hypothetical protein CGL52_12940 [Pyrobaculum aerophilum]|uniref:Uncharacterized protein n=1 Tax=Pyrobaculum aerophilum TaxID=13773 RepID=A0A371QXU3_9CREN|nr:hypothetical protein CGL52_12940 [Pyrobaculum aerophilum]